MSDNYVRGAGGSGCRVSRLWQLLVKKNMVKKDSGYKGICCSMPTCGNRGFPRLAGSRACQDTTVITCYNMTLLVYYHQCCNRGKVHSILTSPGRNRGTRIKDVVSHKAAQRVFFFFIGVSFTSSVKGANARDIYLEQPLERSNGNALPELSKRHVISLRHAPRTFTEQ